MATPTQPPVKGGHPSDKQSPRSFNTTAMPTIFDNSIIIAVTPVLLELAGPNQDAWFLSDFYALCYLLMGATPKGRQQWLSCIPPQDLITKVKDEGGNPVTMLAHGSGEAKRKIVLNQKLLDENKIQKVEVHEPPKLMDAFLDAVEKAAVEAASKDVPLLILTFCHGLDDHALVLGPGGKIVTIEALKERLVPNAKLTLATTSCFSGGWAVYPDFTGTVLAAADKAHLSWSNHASLSISRYSGSVFASRLIENMSSESSGLLSKASTAPGAKSEKATGGEVASLVEAMAGLDIAESKTSLQPKVPNDAQVSTFNSFCQNIVDKVTDVGSFSNPNTFTFAAQEDKFGDSWTGSTGIPLGHFAHRWAELDDYVPQPEAAWQAELRALGAEKMDQTAGSLEETFGSGVYRHAGMAIGLDEAVVMVRAQHVARVFLQTIPNGWEFPNMRGLKNLLRRCVHGRLESENGETAEYVLQAILFRWGYMALVDEIVVELDLPMPSFKTCANWDEIAWEKDIRTTQPDWVETAYEYHTKLRKSGCVVNPHKSQLRDQFIHPTMYLRAALVEGCYPQAEADRLIKQIAVMFSKVSTSFQDCILEDAKVKESGFAWLRSLGKLLRRLSSRKSSKKGKKAKGYVAIKQTDSSEVLQTDQPSEHAGEGITAASLPSVENSGHQGSLVEASELSGQGGLAPGEASRRDTITSEPSTFTSANDSGYQGSVVEAPGQGGLASGEASRRDTVTSEPSTITSANDSGYQASVVEAAQYPEEGGQESDESSQQESPNWKRLY